MLTILPLLFNMGASEIIVIIVLFVILFGGKKIPDLMKGVGRGIREFKDALNKDYSAEDKKDDNDKKQLDK